MKPGVLAVIVGNADGESVGDTSPGEGARECHLAQLAKKAAFSMGAGISPGCRVELVVKEEGMKAVAEARGDTVVCIVVGISDPIMKSVQRMLRRSFAWLGEHPKLVASKPAPEDSTATATATAPALDAV